MKSVEWAHRLKLSQRLPYILVAAVLLSGIATYFQLTIQGEIAEKSKSVVALIYLDVLLLLMLAVIIAKRLVELWVRRKSGQVGSKLHINIVVLFSLVAVLPAILVTLFAGAFLNVGLQAWFGEPVRNAISESKAVAESYLSEHKRNLRFEALALANAIKNDVPELMSNTTAEEFRKNFDQYLTKQEEDRFFNEVLVVRGKNQEIVGKSLLTFALEVDFVPAEDLIRAQSEVVVIREYGDRVRAVVSLDPINDTYLFVGKLVDKSVLKHVEETNNAFSTYSYLENQKSGLAVTFLILFAVITLLLLLSAIWVGLTVATIIVKPIGQLIQAADDVAHGNLDVKVKHDPLNNEIDQLIESFNTMTQKLKSQQQALILSEKKAAWSDIARKIAHEIKNPLTPIQLSAERLKRKYLKVLDGDTETFTQCIDTIVRQVGHIGNLVTEFSNFARMPEPVMNQHDLVEICNHCFQLEKQAHVDINFIEVTNTDSLIFNCDAQQISQVVTNLLQNSVNVLQESHDVDHRPLVRMHLEVAQESIVIRIEDNGPGFPRLGREKLLEPYYTTREKGTGLGLSIVSKIVTDHHGQMELGDSPLGGAMVTLIFKR